MNIKQKAILEHKKLRGKIVVEGVYKVRRLSDLDWLYTPGVAAASLEIAHRRGTAYDLTSKWNNVAIVTDGSRVLGLGNIGAEASIPVMEGKSLLFRLYGGVNAWPVCVKSQRKRDIVDTVVNIEPMFGGINLEDIESPKCFEIEYELKKRLSVPVFHDDQHGTAIVTLAALINALKIAKKDMKKVKVVMAGGGAAGIGVARLLMKAGAVNLVMVDSRGIVYRGRQRVDKYKRDIIMRSRARLRKGYLRDALQSADVFIGLSGVKNLITRSDIRLMAHNSIVFAQTNPDPEILPDGAKAGGALVVATGRSDFPNQVNNAVVFPGVFRGALDNRVKDITQHMMVRAAQNLAGYVRKKDLSPDYVIPRVTDKGVLKVVARAMR